MSHLHITFVRTRWPWTYTEPGIRSRLLWLGRFGILFWQPRPYTYPEEE